MFAISGVRCSELVVKQNQPRLPAASWFRKQAPTPALTIATIKIPLSKNSVFQRFPTSTSPVFFQSFVSAGLHAHLRRVTSRSPSSIIVCEKWPRDDVVFGACLYKGPHDQFKFFRKIGMLCILVG